MQQQSPKRSGPSTIMILGACLLGAAVALFGLNLYQASECRPKSPDELEQYLESINRRLLQAESQNIRNGVMMDKLLHLMQSKLGKLEHQELELISQESQDEAVRISLLLASQPAPPMPQFYVDPKYTDAEKLADIIDDKFEAKDDYETESKGKSKYDDFAEELSITDTEAAKTCEKWKKEYSVVIGISWGSLPQDLQQKWMQYSCDYHLDKSRGGVGGGGKDDKILITREEYSSEKTTLDANKKDSGAFDDILA